MQSTYDKAFGKFESKKSRFKFWVEDLVVCLNNFKNHDFYFVYAELNTFVLVALFENHP